MLATVVAGASALSLTSTATAAPAVGGAAEGGAVIVVLKTQHPGLNERTQASALKQATQSDQAAVLSTIKADGGTDITQLTEPNAIAATLSAAAVSDLRTNSAVARIIPDQQVQVLPSSTLTPPPLARNSVPASRSRNTASNSCPFNPNPNQPLQEGEANIDIHASNGIPGAPDEGNSIATGKGVIIANDGANELAGNPNFIRKDGTPVVINAPDPTADASNDEDYGDASSMVAQGTVVYQYAKALPASTLPIPANCTFVIRGDAPDASLVDLTGIDTPIISTAQAVAGIDAAAVHADVISESFGGGGGTIAQANDAAVAAGVTVVVSSGDSGPQGTFDIQSDDPQVIGAAGTDSFRLIATDDGYSKYVSNQMSALSSGGTAPTGKVSDLSAPSWYGGEAACADGSGGCPPNYPVESMRGTSESAPLIAGASADVIQAYRDSHNGASPTPAMVKDILTGTATDIGAPADLQGAGLLNVYAAVKAAQQMPGSTLGARNGDGSTAVVATPSQLDLHGAGGSSTRQSVSLFNTSNKAVRVNGTFRQTTSRFQIGPVVTEPVSAPDPSLPVGHQGATAAKDIHFSVPRGLAELNLDMIWPDPTNSNRLYYQVFNPQGALEQESYDDGTLPTATRAGSIPNYQHVGISDPTAGRWTVKVYWGGVDQDLALPQPVPGTFTGNLSFKVSGQDFITSPATPTVTIPAHSSRTVPLTITFPRAPGDHPESVQFTAQGNRELESLPVARRTEIPSSGGSFQDVITASVGRGSGQSNWFDINVPAGLSTLTATFEAPDTSADNVITYTLIGPTGATVARTTTPGTGTDPAAATLTATAPASGLYQVEVTMGAAMSGKEFTEVVQGHVTETP